jgi:hypothetical protein
MGCGLSKSRAKKKHLALLLSAFVMLPLLFKVAAPIALNQAKARPANGGVKPSFKVCQYIHMALRPEFKSGLSL